ncbi:hypothetical protein PENTCL1PPCAC_8239, partial [Pristionchus entomophagus]
MERMQEVLDPRFQPIRIKEEPLDDYDEGGDPECRIFQLLQRLSENEARAIEAEEEHTSQLMEWLDKYNESEGCRVSAELAAEDQKRKCSELERTSAEELRELNARYVSALATVSEKTNRAKAMEENEGLRKKLEEMRNIVLELDKEMEDFKESNEEWKRKWEESEMERAEIEETKKILNGLETSMSEANERLEKEETTREEHDEALKEAQTIMTGLQTSLKETNEKLEEERKMKEQFKGERDIFEYLSKNRRMRGDEKENNESWRDRRLSDFQEENEGLKERVERYMKRVRYHDNREKELEEAEDRVKKMDKKREKLVKEVEEAEELCEKLEKERDELKVALKHATEREKDAREEVEIDKVRITNLMRERNDLKRKLETEENGVREEVAIDKIRFASLERERNDLKKKLQIQMGVSMENAFLKSHNAKLEKLIEERKEEERSMQYKKLKMKEEEEKIGRRMEEVEIMKREVEKRLKEIEEERDMEKTEAAKELAPIIAEQKKEMMKEAEEKEKEKEIKMETPETEKEQARFSQMDEEMNQLRAVNAFLVTTPTGKIYLELQQSQEREAQLKQTIELLERSANSCKLEEEEEGEEVKRKRARRNTPKEEQMEEMDEEEEGEE